METFSTLLAICWGNSLVKGQWRGALMFSLIYAWIKGWVNNRQAGDLRRHHAYYDITVMSSWFQVGDETFVLHNGYASFWFQTIILTKNHTIH